MYDWARTFEEKKNVDVMTNQRQFALRRESGRIYYDNKRYSLFKDSFKTMIAMLY